VTPEQADAWTDAVIKLQPFIDTFGPGIALALGATGTCWAFSRAAGAVHDRISHRRDVRRGLRRLEQYADPNGNRELLDEIHRPWKEERP